MVSLGIKQKDMYKSEGKIADYDNEVVYPEVSVSGKLAEKMGAADLEEGEAVRVPVVFRVKRHSKTTTNGSTEYSMTLCIEKMDDEMEQVEPDVDDDLEGEELPTTNALSALGPARDGWLD